MKQLIILSNSEIESPFHEKAFSFQNDGRSIDKYIDIVYYIKYINILLRRICRCLKDLSPE